MRKWTRRAALLGGGAAVGALAHRGFSARQPTLAGTELIGQTTPAGTLNDASLLSATPVHKHVTLTQDAGDALVTALRREMDAAKAAGRPVNVSAARHSMGGQSLPRGGHAITFDNAMVEPDVAKGTYRVHAGARWHQVIAALDPIGYSPKVMQSNNDFGVAATFCVNAHGWPAPLGPMGATVRSIDLLTPDGSLVTCSREQEAELFYQTMGGYGLTMGQLLSLPMILLGLFLIWRARRIGLRTA